MMNVNNQPKFSKGWSAELSGFYRSKGVDGQIMILPSGRYQVVFPRKQVLKKIKEASGLTSGICSIRKIEGYMNFKIQKPASEQKGFKNSKRHIHLPLWKTIKDNRSNRKTGVAQRKNQTG